MSRSGKSSGKRARQEGKPKREATTRPVARGAHGDVLDLHRSAGNEAVRGLLASSDERIPHAVDQVPTDVDAVLAAGGRPLDSGVRAELEPLVGDDLSDVRVHTDAAAEASAEAVAARAYTSGRQLVFGPGAYSPDTEQGRSLIAHEVGHAVTARAGGVPSAGAPVLRQPKDDDKPGAGLLSKSTVPGPQVMTLAGSTVATIHFAHDSFLMDPANFAAVEKLGEQLSFMAKPLVSVNGHASAEGPAKRNDQLARMRRETVIAILRSKAKGSFDVGGAAHGSSEPAVEENATKPDELEAQRASNRRVEMIIVDLATPQPPTAAAKPEPKPIDTTYHPKQETPAEEANRNLQRMLKLGPIPTAPKTSFNEQFWKGVDKVVDDMTAKLHIPEALRGPIKDGAHAAIEKGAEKALDGALDAAKITGQEREALKAAIKAAAEQKF